MDKPEIPETTVFSEDWPQGEFAQLLKKELEKYPEVLDDLTDIAADPKLMP
jgi:hypothetical protein